MGIHSSIAAFSCRRRFANGDAARTYFCLLTRLHVILEELLIKWDCKLIEFNGEADHVHALLQYHPDLLLSTLIGNIKASCKNKLYKFYFQRTAKSRFHIKNCSGYFYTNPKSTTSRKLRLEFGEYLRRFYTKNVFWNGSYFVASCGGVTREWQLLADHPPSVAYGYY